MSDRPSSDLAASVRRRTSAESLRVPDQTELPLVHPVSSVGSVQAQADQEQASGATPGGEEDGAQTQSSADQPSPEQVADRVYELLVQELRVERERLGR